jgi:hypothetical protein
MTSPYIAFVLPTIMPPVSAHDGGENRQAHQNRVVARPKCQEETIPELYFFAQTNADSESTGAAALARAVDTP